jgi:hypothetical protein
MRELQDPDVGSDTPDAWVADLIDLGMISTEQAPAVSTLFKAVFDARVSGLFEMEQRRNREIGVLPYLKSVGTTVELRGVFDRSFRLGDDLGSYAPQLLSVTPIVSVSIGLDSGTPEGINFQASPDDLQFLIEVLKAAQHECRILRDGSVLAKPTPAAS